MKTYKISDISIYPFNENGKKFVDEIRCYLNTNKKLTERINNMLKNIDYSLLPEGIKFEFK